MADPFTVCVSCPSQVHNRAQAVTVKGRCQKQFGTYGDYVDHMKKDGESWITIWRAGVVNGVVSGMIALGTSKVSIVYIDDMGSKNCQDEWAAWPILRNAIQLKYHTDSNGKTARVELYEGGPIRIDQFESFFDKPRVVQPGHTSSMSTSGAQTTQGSSWVVWNNNPAPLESHVERIKPVERKYRIASARRRGPTHK